MFPVLLFFLLLLQFAEPKARANEGGDSCPLTHQIMGKIGAVIDHSSRVGQEQKIAMEMAVTDFSRSSCSKQLLLLFEDSRENLTKAASTAAELISSKQVHTIITTITAQEAGFLSEIEKNIKSIPIISLTSPAITPPLMEHQFPYFIQMSYHITLHMQCIAAVVDHFKWRKVTAIYEHKNDFLAYSGIITLLSDTLNVVNSEIEYHSAIPPLNPESAIGQELTKLRSKSNRVFIVLVSSLELAVLLFEKAKQMLMMEKGYVWIVTDEIASLLDSVDSSVVNNMQGVVGFRSFIRTGNSYKRFKSKFRRKYGSRYPDEEEYSNPSIFALRAYDATWTIAQAMEKSQGNITSEELSRIVLSSNFVGLSGNVRIGSNGLWQSPAIFQIINIVGNSYREIALWSSNFGFLENNEKNNGLGSMKELRPVYWPGGMQTVPKGWSIGDADKPLRIGVPARGAFHQFVKVTFDPTQNGTCTATGFSIKVFEAVVKCLPYNLPYLSVPFYGTYDEMVEQVHLKGLDGAVGDIGITADRFLQAEFSLPYLDSRLVMIVPAKPEMSQAIRMLNTFTINMWLLMAAMHVLTGFLVWIIERGNNKEFEGIGAMLWFSITVIFYADRQPLTSNISRLVLTPWLFVIFIVITSFTANLSSTITVSRLQPSVLDIETLRRTNAPVGCNEKSFIARHLTNVLLFKPENIKKISSMDDYPEAFQTGLIKAAFLSEPHAEVFLGKYCKGYTKAGPTFKLGGLGFVFPKGSPLVFDVSAAILKFVESEEMAQLEALLSLSNCSSETSPSDTSSLGIEHFAGLFILSSSISALGFLVAVFRMGRNLQILSDIQTALTGRRIWRWVSIQLSRESSTISKTNEQVHPSSSL